MSYRFIALLCGLAFFGGLGVVVGQRVPAQAMVVVIGVMAGAATSIPTSLLVVWFMLRNVTLISPVQSASDEPPPGEPFTAPPDWTPTASAPLPPEYQTFTGYRAATYPPPEEAPPRPAPVRTAPPRPAPAPRRFTVVDPSDDSEFE